MKKAIIGYVRVVEYGTVEVLVPDNATDEEIEEAILNAEDEGAAVWGNRTVNVTDWEENPDYAGDDIDD